MFYLINSSNKNMIHFENCCIYRLRTFSHLNIEIPVSFSLTIKAKLAQ